MPPSAVITKKPQPPVQTAVAAAPPTPPRIRTLGETSPEYAAVATKMDALNRDLSAATAEFNRLQIELGVGAAVSAVRREALELLGENTPGGAAAELAKHASLKAAQNRAAVLREAVSLYQPTFETARHEAWRQLMQEATPARKALLAVHAVSVVAAAKSRLAVVQFCDAVAAVAPPASYGFGDQTFGSLGDARDHSSGASLWIGELIGLGIIQGTESWLDGLAVIARRPDGSAVDHASPVPSYMAEAPAPATAKNGIVSAVAGAVRQGAAAVASAFAPAPRTGDVNPADAALPATGPRPVGSPSPSQSGPTRRIKLLKEMATTTDYYGPGDTPLWEAGDAARLVAAGRAEWFTDASPVISPPVSNTATSGV
jgi:hypothetical protein